MDSTISNLAFVHPEAKIGDNVRIGAFCYIDRDVVIGDNCHIHSHVSILAGARLGKGNEIFEGSIISARPQDFRWKGEESEVIIGDNNTIREHVIINRSIYKNQATKIGHGSFIMAQCHIGHDSEIGSKCVLGNAVKVAGACKIGDCTILSSNALVHENCHVGNWVLIKGGCRVTSNVPPYTIMAHNPIAYYGVNAYVMLKNGFNEDQVNEIAKCYRHLYQSMTSPFNAMKRIEVDIIDSPEKNAILEFVRGHEYKVAGVPLAFEGVE